MNSPRIAILAVIICTLPLLGAPVAWGASGSHNGNGNVGVGNGNGNGNGNSNGNGNGSHNTTTATNNNAISASSTNASTTSATNALTINGKSGNNTPSVYAPGLAAAGIESCLGSGSVGASGAGFGITVGGTTQDKDCNIRLYSRSLYAMGHRAAALQLLCFNPDVAHALVAEGIYCGAAARAEPVAEYMGPGVVAAAAQEDTRAAPSAPAPCQHYELLGGCRDAVMPQRSAGR